MAFDIRRDTKYYEIETLADFPVAHVAGVLNLPAGYYKINTSQLVLPYSIRPAGSLVIEGHSNIIAYVGGANFLDIPDINNSVITFKSIVIVDGIGDTATFADMANSSDGTGGIIMENSAVVNFGSLGTFDNCVSPINYTRFLNFGDGFTFNDMKDAVIDTCVLNPNPSSSGAIVFNITGTNDVISIGQCESSIYSNQSWINIDAGSTAGIGSVRDNIPLLNGTGTIFEPASKDQTDVEWIFKLNRNIQNSTTTIERNLENNGLSTDIPAVDALVLINATTFTYINDERMTANSDGTTEYIGLEPVKLKIDGNINLEPATATKLIETRIINFRSPSEFECTFDNTTNIVLRTDHGKINGDTISFYETAGTLPVELRKDVLYYVVNKTDNNFQVSYTSGGAAVAFTDDGTPTNAYIEAFIIGGIASAEIGAGSPIDVIPQGLIILENGDKVGIFVKNKIDAVDIDVNTAYYRVNE